MQTLKSQNICHLSEGILKLLHQNRIITISDFLQEDVMKLAAITKLNLPDILAIRNNIFGKYSSPVTNGTALLQKVLTSKRKISSGIESVDAVTNGGIPVGYLTEMCGLTESGKTQLSFQLVINCVKCSENTALYVDTKGDFSAVRIQKILEAQECSAKEMSLIMRKIKVVRIWAMEELIALFRGLKNKTISIENLSLVIVDSLSSVMFQHHGDENKIGLSYLNTVVNYSRFIANEFNVGIIFINIQTRWVDSDPCDIEGHEEGVSAFKEPTYIEKRNRCLGKYWNQVPALVLLLEKTLFNSNDTNGCTSVKVSVLSSNNIKTLCNECVINIGAKGIM